LEADSRKPFPRLTFAEELEPVIDMNDPGLIRMS